MTAATSSHGRLGMSIPRHDGPEKVSGRAFYTADMRLPGMLHAKVLRSPRAHARLVSIDAEAARALPGVAAVLTRDSIPAGIDPALGYLIKDQSIVATEKVRFEGDIVAAVAAVDEATAIEALGLIRVEYADLPAVATVEEALADTAPELFEDAPRGVVPRYGKGASALLRPVRNACFEFRYRTGDESAFDGCDHIFEDEFRFSRMTHFHLEPFVTLAETGPGRIQIWASSQNPFTVRRELSRIFGLPENAITVNVPYVGGGFGSKTNCRTEPIAVLLSMLSGRPVRLCFTLEEGALTNTQHAAVLRLRTGVARDGTLIARASRILLDAGAYSDASPLVAEKVGYRIHGPYRYRFIDSSALCVMTNTAPAGAFRGFGGTQASWASESQIDMIAERIGLDPYEMRRRNLLKLGEPYAPGDSGIDSDLMEGLDLVCREIGYHGRNRAPNKGIGIAIGFKDGGGVHKAAQARIKVSTNGDVFVQCGTIEIGQGSRTAIAQIAAESLKIPLERVSFMPFSTDHTPFDQGTNASSGIAVMGQAVAQAAENLRRTVIDFAAGQLGCDAGELALEDWTIRRGAEAFPMPGLIIRHFGGGSGFEFTGEGFYRIASSDEAALEAPCVFWEIGWGAAEVEVDPDTGKVTVTRLVVSGDAGKAIHKAACRGQDEGAAVMGLGQTLFERMLYDGTTLLNRDPLDYRVPLAEDLPEHFVAITQEQGHGPGPFGAKGMGEGGILPVASAIANAVHDATGLRITELPIAPQTVLAALEARRLGEAEAAGTAPALDREGGAGES